MSPEQVTRRARGRAQPTSSRSAACSTRCSADGSCSPARRRRKSSPTLMHDSAAGAVGLRSARAAASCARSSARCVERDPVAPLRCRRAISRWRCGRCSPVPSAARLGAPAAAARQVAGGAAVRERGGEPQIDYLDRRHHGEHHQQPLAARRPAGRAAQPRLPLQGAAGGPGDGRGWR